MRIRIIRGRPGEIDGVDLSAFAAGSVYDVSPSLGTYLVMTGTADPVMEDRPGGVPSTAPSQRAIAADRRRPDDRE